MAIAIINSIGSRLGTTISTQQISSTRFQSGTRANLAVEAAAADLWGEFNFVPLALAIWRRARLRPCHQRRRYMSDGYLLG